MARESLPGTLPHESPTFGLDDSRVTMKDAAGMFEQLAALFNEIGENQTSTPHMRQLAALGAYYAHEHAAGQHAGLEVDSNHLEDCAGHLEAASEYFGHLESLFLAIKERAAEGQAVKPLAEIGRYSANDFANTLDVARERALATAEVQA